MSLVIGIFIPGIVFGKYELDPVTDEKIVQGRKNTFDLMLVEFVIALICLVPNLLLQQNKPPTPPS